MRGAVLLAIAAPLLAGCPATWGFEGAIRAKRDPAARVDVVALRPGSVSAENLVAVPGAGVVCEGCERAIVVGADGRFAVGLGTSYGAPKSIVLHVTAPGYETVDLEIPRPGMASEAGPPMVLVILRPKP